MAEITVASKDAATTDEAVQAALVTGYVIRHDDDSGTATVVAPDLTAKDLTQALGSP